MNREQILKNARLAGSVVRYHTFPMIHRETIGEHSWNVMRIYWQIWGPLPPELSTYFIWHDAGELVCGDLPFPIKANNPKLKAEMDVLEEEAVEGMNGISNSLQPILKIRAKACDLIDMWSLGCTELCMGNKVAQPIIDDTFKALEKLSLSMDDQNLIFKYLTKCKAFYKDNLS